MHVFSTLLTGAAFRRCGFSTENECGSYWKGIDDAPKGTILKQISVGQLGIWTVDGQGQLLVRREVCDAFPEGSHWQVLQNVLNDPPHEEGKMGFRSVSVTDAEVWAVSNSNFVCRRSGVTAKNPAGTGWQLGISVRYGTTTTTDSTTYLIQFNNSLIFYFVGKLQFHLVNSSWFIVALMRFFFRNRDIPARKTKHHFIALSVISMDLL